MGKIAEYTTDDGYKLTVYGTLYLSYGLTIEKDGEELFTSPHALDCASYGRKPNPALFDEDECDPWEAAEDSDDPNAWIAWTSEDWIDHLKHDHELIECFIDIEAT